MILVTRSVGVSRGATWLPDDTIVFATTAAGTGLLRVASSGGDAQTITVPDTKAGESDHLWPEALPGGRAVLFTVMSGGGIANAQIAAVDLQNRHPKKSASRWHARHVSADGPPALFGRRIDARRALRRGPARDSRRPGAGARTDDVSSVGAVNASISSDGTLVYVPAPA
jgi:hypothetical protein